MVPHFKTFLIYFLFIFIIAFSRLIDIAFSQVRSECLTWTFRASCCNARLSRAQLPASIGSSVRDRKIALVTSPGFYLHFVAAPLLI